MLKEQAGYLWTWWKNDALPLLPPLAGWHVDTSTDATFLARLSTLSVENAKQRLREGHRIYIGYMGKTPVAYGWLAINAAEFGHPTVKFHVPVDNLYLYHFVTFLPWRRQGFYSRLLQTILQYESESYSRFWIIHQFANTASQKGIARAGFCIASSIFHSHTDALVLVPGDNQARTQAGSLLLGLPLIEKRL
jgi:GNAT superfamily N-acetyltransferase